MCCPSVIWFCFLSVVGVPLIAFLVLLSQSILLLHLISLGGFTSSFKDFKVIIIIHIIIVICVISTFPLACFLTLNSYGLNPVLISLTSSLGNIIGGFSLKAIFISNISNLTLFVLIILIFKVEALHVLAAVPIIRISSCMNLLLQILGRIVATIWAIGESLIRNVGSKCHRFQRLAQGDCVKRWHPWGLYRDIKWHLLHIILFLEKVLRSCIWQHVQIKVLPTHSQFFFIFFSRVVSAGSSPVGGCLSNCTPRDEFKLGLKLIRDFHSYVLMKNFNMLNFKFVFKHSHFKVIYLTPIINV